MSSKKRTSSSSNSSSAKKARFGADTKSDSVDPASLALDTMNTWQVEEEIAEAMIPVVGRMYRRENVVLTLFNLSLASLSPMDIIKLHATTRDHRNRPVKITDTWPIIEALQHRRLSPMRVDIGQLSLLVAKARKAGRLLSISDEVGKYVTASEEKAVRTNPMDSARDVVLYGFGRIGRLLARLLIEKTGTGSKLRLRAIVVRKSSIPDLAKRANLLMTDSVHSTFNGRVEIDLERNVIIANGNTIHLIYSKGPDQVDYTKYGINNAVVVDNTGIWRDDDKDTGLGLHLKSKGVAEVVLTAPGKGNVPNIVMGVNSNDYFGDDVPPSDVHIYSAASCSTNAVVPVLKLVDEKWGIENGHIETIHSFTNDQNLIDNFHKKARRGRSAVLNMVLTETGAAKASVKVLPNLKGKLTAGAVRVPTPNVSMAILVLNLKSSTTKSELNAYIQERATRGPLMHQVDYSHSTEAVSSDFVGCRAASIVDGPNTVVSGSRVNLYVWYDNEFGYSCQVVRLLQALCKIAHPRCPLPLMEHVQSEAEDDDEEDK
jgi:glyceraldehyde 3-phosphate dehydrogenase